MERQFEESILPVQVSYATFWQRFAAAFIDGLIIMIPNYLLRSIGGIGSLLSLVFAWLYCALQESSAGQATVGKKAMGIKVTNMQGGRISFGQATGRYFGKYISAIIIFIGFLMVLWDDKKQALHDKMAGTLVVSSKQ